MHLQKKSGLGSWGGGVGIVWARGRFGIAGEGRYGIVGEVAVWDRGGGERSKTTRSSLTLRKRGEGEVSKGEGEKQ